MPTRNKGKRVRISPRVSLRKSVVTDPRSTVEVGRNDPCPCGSGKKYKNCCVDKGDHYLRKLAKQKAKEEAKEKKKEQGGLLTRLFKRSGKSKAS